MSNRYQPWAKFASVVFTLGLTLAYNRLLDSTFSKPQLFYLVGAVYTVRSLLACIGGGGLHRSDRACSTRVHTNQHNHTHIVSCVAQVLFLVIASLLPDPSKTEEEAAVAAVPGSPRLQLLGWASYLAIESYGSLTVAMFWAFTNSSVHLEGAKSVYGLILAGAQVSQSVSNQEAAEQQPHGAFITCRMDGWMDGSSIERETPTRPDRPTQVGAIVGSTLATRATYLSLPHLYTLGGLTPAFMALLVHKYTRTFGLILPPEALKKGA